MDNTTSDVPAKAGTREWIGLGVIALACLLYVMDLTVLHLAVPSLSADLQPSSTQLLWIIDIYGFMVAGFLITMGTLGDRIGRRKLLLVGAVVFGLFSLLAAYSKSAEMLIVSRALLGIAGATIAPSTLSLIFNMFRDPNQRSKAIAVWISAFSAGSAIGPVLGGILLANFWWGSVFLLAVPVMVLLLILGPIVLPEYRDPKEGRLDLISAIMSLASILAIIFGLKQIAQNGIDYIPIILILVGFGIGYLFVRRQLTLNDPMLDLRLFKIPAFSASLLVNVLSVFVAFGYFLFVAQYFQLVEGLTPLRAGFLSVPSAIAFIIGSNLIPRIAYNVRPAYILGGGLIMGAIGLAVLAGVGSWGLSAVVLSSIIISLGIAPVFGLTTELIVGSAPPERAGAASGIAETASEFGGALGISILGSIGVAIYRSKITKDLPPEIPSEIVTAARDTLGAAVNLAQQLPQELAEQFVTVVRQAFLEGMVVAAIICTVVAAVAAILAMVMLKNAKRGSE